MENQQTEPFVNPYCTEQCINNLRDGKLQCNCAETGIYCWSWEKQEDTSAILLQNNSEIIFHPVFSSGTAALRGNTPFKKNFHYFWEMKMTSKLYGTDIMVGVGTAKLILTECKYRFSSLLGSNKQSWGYSYNGFIQHDNATTHYGSKFGLGSLIGVHLDMCAGTLEYYLNRKPLGVAFTGLKTCELYPMVCSTAAQSAMRMTYAASEQPSLQFTCLHYIVKDSQLYAQFKKIPGLARMYEDRFFWWLSKECDDGKRKGTNDHKFLKRRKLYSCS